jgi:hypothetical protein
MPPEPPAITGVGWGTIEVDGGAVRFRDAKLWPTGARGWDWRETGTHHVPGIQPADVEELLEHDVDLVVLSKGQWNRLRVAPATLRRLEEQGVETLALLTGQAVETYNDVRTSRRVGALIHSTC